MAATFTTLTVASLTVLLRRYRNTDLFSRRRAAASAYALSCSHVFDPEQVNPIHMIRSSGSPDNPPQSWTQQHGPERRVPLSLFGYLYFDDTWFTVPILEQYFLRYVSDCSIYRTQKNPPTNITYTFSSIKEYFSKSGWNKVIKYCPEMHKIFLKLVYLPIEPIFVLLKWTKSLLCSYNLVKVRSMYL